MKNEERNMVLVIKVGDTEHKVDFQQEVRISEETINEDLKDQPGKYVYFAILQEMAEAEHQEAKLYLELKEAELDSSIREEAQRVGEKITEKRVMTKITLDDSYIEARTDVNLTRTKVGKLKAVKEGLNHRKDMLITLASNMRTQWDHKLWIKESEQK